MMDLIQQLRRDEGVRYIPYRDSRGFWTNGVGHKLTAAELDATGMPLSMSPVTDDQVDKWLDDDIKADTGFLNNLPWFQVLDPIRQAVFQNMAYNMGPHRLLGFPSMIHYATVEDWPNTAAQMRSSIWAEQVGSRAVRLEQQVETGQWV